MKKALMLMLVLCLVSAPVGALSEPYGEGVVLDGSLPIVRDGTALEKMTILKVTSPECVTDPNEMIQTKRLNEATGVEFEWITIPSEGSIEKINLMLASRDLPDVFWNGISNDTLVQYINQDVFIPTEDLMKDYMPRLTKLFEENPKYWAGSTLPDGHHYGFPYIEEMFGLVLTSGPFVINVDWLKQCGLEMPTTIDEFKQALIAFRDAGDLNGNGVADEIPYELSFTATDTFGTYNTFNMFVGCFGETNTAGGNRTSDNMKIGPDGKVRFTAMSDAYRQCVEFFYGLQQEGLIGIDSFAAAPTAGSALLADKIKQEDAVLGAFSTWSMPSDVPVVSVYEQYQPMPRLTGPRGAMGHALNFSEMQNVGQCTITTKCKYPEVVAAWVDYLFEPEVSVTTNWGPEGYCFVRDEETGLLKNPLDENGYFKPVEGYSTYNEMRSNFTPIWGSMAILNSYYDTVCEYPIEALPLLEYQRINGKDAVLAEGNPIPILLMTADEQAKVSQIQPQIASIVTTYTMQMILDGNIDALWSEYLGALEAAGVNELMAEYQVAYDRYIEAMDNI